LPPHPLGTALLASDQAGESLRVGISGHQKMPALAEVFARHALKDFLSERKIEIGISSLAEGSDQLFSRVLLEGGISLKVIVPCSDYERAFSDPKALLGYHEILSRACDVEYLAYSEPSELAFLAAGHRIVDQVDLLVAIWDGQPAKGLGGTADIVDYARSMAKPVVVLWPSGIAR
jgi:hypothetical protein